MTPYHEEDGITIYLADARTADLPGDVMVTDPPYGMGLRSGRGGAFGQSTIEGDDTTETRDIVLSRWAPGPALVFGRWSVPRPAGTRMVLIWEKGEHVGMGALDLPWKPNAEEVYVLGKGFTGHRGGSVLRHLAIAGTVGQGARGDRFHATEKPVDLMRALIRKCPPGVILDPFMGSGSTLVAAKAEGRQAVGLELYECYCEIAAKRLAQGVLAL